MPFLTSFFLAITISCGPDISSFPAPLGVERPGLPGTERSEPPDRETTDSPLLESDELDSTIVSPTSLSISPTPVSLRPNESTRFRVDAFDHNGQPMQVVPIFQATGGTIEQDGTYTAGTGTGIFNVTVRVGDLSATAVIVISDTAAPTTLEITPPEALVSPGGTVDFEAVVRDQDGNPMGRTVTWMATGGSITSTGLYSAGGTTGIYTVIASSEGLSTTATVTISPTPSSASIAVNPTTVDLQPGESHQFAVEVHDQDGNPLDAPATWDATGGSIDQNGTYTAGSQDGDFTVRATSGGLSTSASVHITAAAAPTSETVIFKENFESNDFTKWGSWAPAGDPTAAGVGGGGAHIGEGYITDEISHSGKYAWRGEVDPSTPQPDPSWQEGKSSLERWRLTEGLSEFYISAWYLIPTDYPPLNSQLMQIKAAGTGSSHKPVGVRITRDRELIIRNGILNTIVFRTGVKAPAGRWFNLKGRFVIADVGIVEVWLDGQKIASVQTDTKDNDYAYFGVGNYVFSPDARSHLYIDDITVSASR